MQLVFGVNTYAAGRFRHAGAKAIYRTCTVLYVGSELAYNSTTTKGESPSRFAGLTSLKDTSEPLVVGTTWQCLTCVHSMYTLHSMYAEQLPGSLLINTIFARQLYWTFYSGVEGGNTSRAVFCMLSCPRLAII